MKWLPVLLLVLIGSNVLGASPDDTLTFGRFGVVHIYHPEQAPQSVAIFVSGDGGWNAGVVDMARSLSGLGALVIGTDIVHYLKALQQPGEACLYPASDFEALSQYVQKKLDLPEYRQPILVGYSSGATLVYALLVQAPPNTFAGALSLGFCPDLPLTRPMCKGHGLTFEPGPKGKGFNFLPAKSVSAPWVAFQGDIDQVCDSKWAADYVKRIAGARLVPLPKVGHGFSVERNWLPQFKQAYTDIVASIQQENLPAAPPEISDLPLVTVPAAKDSGSLMACIITGDGGWASIDRDVGNALAAQGIPVVALNSLKYFWQRRTPDEAGQDLARILNLYLQKWHKEAVVLVGYSRGADVLPFMASRLPEELVQRTRLVALLGPSTAVDFKLHLTDFLGNHSRKEDLPTLPEINKLKGRQVVCFYGSDEKESVCRQLDSTAFRLVQMQGGHHFGGAYDRISEQILDLLK